MTDGSYRISNCGEDDFLLIGAFIKIWSDLDTKINRGDRGGVCGELRFGDFLHGAEFWDWFEISIVERVSPRCGSKSGLTEAGRNRWNMVKGAIIERSIFIDA